MNHITQTLKQWNLYATMSNEVLCNSTQWHKSKILLAWKFIAYKVF
jgi:hypothetical protein